ncbi:unnamed protein product [Sphagnum jensenii]|uniref:Uncharacterized protein n=1 Tax=Sphagnum jensenii TaxID=128206 RepID=A0ABP0VH61_9BRYO
MASGILRASQAAEDFRVPERGGFHLSGSGGRGTKSAGSVVRAKQGGGVVACNPGEGTERDSAGDGETRRGVLPLACAEQPICGPGLCRNPSIWLTTKKTCDIPLERSRRDLQVCFGPRFHRRSAPKVMRVQSPGSPAGRDFGTPARESRESRDKMSIWVPPPRPGAEYTIGSEVVAHSQARGVVCESESEFTRGCPNSKRTQNEF